jgi:myotubularin-related protein 1/2
MKSFQEMIPSDVNIPLLPGERHVCGVTKEVTYLCPFMGPVRGKLFITNYKMYFYGDDGDPPYTVDVPMGVISRVEKIGGSTSRGENAYGLEIYCKDMRNLRFAHKQEKHSRRLVYDKLMTFAFPTSSGSGKKVFSFDYKETFNGVENGWGVYDIRKEFERQGALGDEWRLTEVNKGFAICDTYPELLCVPTATSDDLLKQVAAYRSRGRIPVLCWIHKENRASITRCSQPLVGKLGKRCREDEVMLHLIKKVTPGSNKLYIIDARPKLNAVANMV